MIVEKYQEKRAHRKMSVHEVLLHNSNLYGSNPKDIWTTLKWKYEDFENV